jgi:NitT/TauT family transport system substrate-binding protein
VGEASAAGGPRKLRFILNTFVSGPQAWFFVADERGYFRTAGLDVHMTPGDTLANAVPRIASGEFDAGYGDLNALIELAARGDAPDVIAVFATFNASPYTIAVPATSAVKTPHDLEGQCLATHPNDAALRMLPELAMATGLDPQRLEIEVSTLHHRDILAKMLRENAWDGLFGFVNTIRAAAIEAGIDPDRDLRFLEYSTFMPDPYGAAVMVRRSLAEQEPAVVAGLVGAVNRGVLDVIADVDAGIDAVARRDPAIDRAANRARLVGTLALEMAHPEGARLGIGDMDDARLGRAIDLIVAAKKLPRRPGVDEIFTRRFLSPPDTRARNLARGPG